MHMYLAEHSGSNTVGYLQHNVEVMQKAKDHVIESKNF